LLKERADQSSNWENEANLWKNKYNELQQTLTMFNINIEKYSGVGRDGKIMACCLPDLPS
jgi:hypothetical protein